jgi:hypothetical protein
VSQWPAEVPILTANDMCKGDYVKGVRCCLLGRLDEVFKSESADIFEEARRQIQMTLGEELDCGHFTCVISFNDSHPLTLNARVWNRAMYRLGYTVNNPENKPLKGVK